MQPSDTQANSLDRSVVVLKTSDITVRDNDVFMPNTIEMAQIKKPEKGQFKKVQITKEMTEGNVTEKLLETFPYLRNHRFYCAAAVDNRTRLDFNGDRRIWNGRLIRRFLKGNSALYIYVDEQVPGYANMAPHSLPIGSSVHSRESHFLTQPAQSTFCASSVRDSPKELQDSSSPEQLTTKRPPEQMTTAENELSNQTFKKLRATKGVSNNTETDVACDLNAGTPLRALGTATVQGGVSEIASSCYQTEEQLQNLSCRNADMKESAHVTGQIEPSSFVCHQNLAIQEAKNTTTAIASHSHLMNLSGNLPLKYPAPQMSSSWTSEHDNHASLQQFSKWNSPLPNLSNNSPNVNTQVVQPMETDTHGLNQELNSSAISRRWASSDDIAQFLESVNCYLQEVDVLGSEIDISSLSAISEMDDSKVTPQASNNVGLHNQNQIGNTIQMTEPLDAMQTQLSHGMRGINSDSGLGSQSSNSAPQSRHTSDIENGALNGYQIIKMRPNAVGLSGAPACDFLRLAELFPEVQAGRANVGNLEKSIQWVKGNEDGKGDCIPPSPKAGKQIVSIYSETGKKLAEAELWYVDPCHHTDEECFQRVINSATRSPADLWRFMSKLNIHITNQPSVKSGEPEDSGNFGSSQKVQVLWLLFYKAAESGVKGHSLPLPEFAAMNHDHENAALYLEEITKRYASELFPEGPKRIDWSDFLAAINGSHEQDEGSDTREDESRQLDGRSDSDSSYYGDVESLSCDSVEPISHSVDDLSEILSKASFKEDEENTVEKDEHEIISQPFNDLPWPQLGEKVQFDEAFKKNDVISASKETVQFDEAPTDDDVTPAAAATVQFDKAPEDDVTPAAEETVRFDEATKENDVTSAAVETVLYHEARKEDNVTPAAEGTVQFDKAPEEDDVKPATEEKPQFDEGPKETNVSSATEETVQFDEAPKEKVVTPAAKETDQFDEAQKETDVISASEETVQCGEAPKETDVISTSEEKVQFDEAPKENDVISAAEETVQFDEAPKEDHVTPALKENDVRSAIEETIQFDEAPKEIELISAAEEIAEFDKAPKENIVISAAEETVQFNEGPTENDVTTAFEENLQFDDDTLRAISEVYKNEGNDEYKKKNFSSAIYFYTEGIKVNCKDEELNAKLYSNRAAAHFNLGNYSETVNDANAAIELQPHFLKAFVRGASACIQMKKYNEANAWCDKGLAREPNNQKLLELQKTALGELRKLQESNNNKKTATKVTYMAKRSRDDKAYRILGNAHHSLRDFKTAIDYHKRLLKIARDLGDRSAEGTAYGNLGNAYYSLGDFKTAMDYHQRQLKIAKDLGDRSGEGNAYGNLGSVYYSLGDFKTGIDYHKRHLKIAKELGDRSGQGSLYGNLGIAYYSLGDFKTAMNYHEHHLKIAKDLGDRSGEGTVYSNLGNVYCSLGDFKTAMDYHRRHLKIAKDLGDRSGEATAYSNLGRAYYSLGDFKAAIDFHQLHLKIAKDLSDRSGEGIAYGNLGNAYYSLQDFKTAIDCRQCHLEILKELRDRSGEGKEYGNLGHAYYNLGDFKTAINYHQRHLKIVKELSDRLGEADAYNNLGYVHNSLGDYKSAIDFHERTLKIARELGDRSGEGVAYGNLGNAYHNLGDFKTAKDYLERCLEIAKELGERSKTALAYANLGNVHQCLGDFETAIDYYELFLKIAKQLGDISGEGKAYNNLGNTHRSLGHDKTAIDYHQRHLRIVKELGDRLGEGAAYGNLGNAFRCLGEFQTAIDYHERALKIARELNDKLGEGLACSFLGFDFQCLGQFQMAIKYYQLAITLSNNLRDRLQFNDDWKISLRDQYQTIYAELWRLLLADGEVTEALFSAEQGRAQGLKDLMTLNYSFEANDVRRVKETGTFHELSSFLPVNTIFMAMGWQEVIFWVCQKGKDVKVRRKQISSQDDVKTSQDEVKTFFQSLVNKIGPRDFVKCEDRSLELAKDKRLAFERSPQDGRQTQPLHLQEAALRALYDTIIVPIQDLFSGSELVFIPEGPLCLAPFAAFMSPDSKYLCESFSIRVAPSLTSLKMIMECPVDYHHTSGVLLVGDPWVQDVTKLPTLPFARKEVEMIGKILGCKPLIGRQATRDEVLKRLGSAALVHIAAHGKMETGEIALAPSSEKDFILTMKDVKSAQIRARLVVLSCCHSARGEIKAEGVVGIARAFLGAGARSVLVSLWAIDDKATLEFMTNFYHHLVKGKSASKALNQAMNCMRESEEFSCVIDWAPFVLIGDDVTLEFGESK